MLSVSMQVAFVPERELSFYIDDLPSSFEEFVAREAANDALELTHVSGFLPVGVTRFELATSTSRT
jgi:hypothetical protein